MTAIRMVGQGIDGQFPAEQVAHTFDVSDGGVGTGVETAEDDLGFWRGGADGYDCIAQDAGKLIGGCVDGGWIANTVTFIPDLISDLVAISGVMGGDDTGSVGQLTPVAGPVAVIPRPVAPHCLLIENN